MSVKRDIPEAWDGPVARCWGEHELQGETMGFIIRTQVGKIGTGDSMSESRFLDYIQGFIYLLWKLYITVQHTNQYKYRNKRRR